jgi:uncharacterized membrane protein YkoI
MNVRRISTTAAAAALSLLVLGGTAYALGTGDTPQVAPAAATTTAIPTPAASVPVERARELAVAEVGGGEVTKVESEVEHGRLEWKVVVLSGGVEHDVRIDATTGAVTGQNASTPTTAAPVPAPAPAPKAPAQRAGDDRVGHDVGDDHGGRHGGDDHGGHSGRH